jgi:hypothetical protein
METASVKRCPGCGGVGFHALGCNRFKPGQMIQTPWCGEVVDGRDSCIAKGILHAYLDAHDCIQLSNMVAELSKWHKGETDDLRAQLKAAEARVKEQDATITRLREGLAFYADQRKYWMSSVEENGSVSQFKPTFIPIVKDGGALARSLLDVEKGKTTCPKCGEEMTWGSDGWYSEGCGWFETSGKNTRDVE